MRLQFANNLAKFNIVSNLCCNNRAQVKSGGKKCQFHYYYASMNASFIGL
jgi:hypothetical protein